MGCFVLNKLWEIIKKFFDGIFKALEFVGLWWFEIIMVIVLLLQICEMIFDLELIYL